ncbi:dihydrolipoamide acetyltransferase family protein [Spiroplasma platyhelix]|uniref:Dihydrolipoamide acetyltransferase component of pyruvate dehydrogenase complex n=1 Tax=Spiroplasma platyhelix PALS-1 TaxID=1276218 RepID=A0A846TWH0_9MOLU|nr:dihydrolipoamide acetyltransferase family protein [Spiroplasma platyhelix]MBE4703988.1 Dihydrolipoyllysine-residue acetyltransferase component of pyruvate dehydrogenase complex [Spiroplasma platyhelix PALS-1]NKE38361.1 2-oxo acid dehydrogenase subunit E2 [Spiroplasma platyhelix PALS-1]UJB29246.1 pyruvate dehydrogenase E2 component (dihydrolipoamide acetyltransferase) [Spiroplasma platyhelix PALS-1]
MQEFKFAGMDGIDEVTISSIHIKVGQEVKKGDTLFDVEADKAADSINSPFDGKVSKINFKSGDTIKTGDIIVEFGGSNAQASDVIDKELKSESETQKVQSESAKETKTNDKVLATPLARRIARELGIDIVTIKGTGPNGRVLKTDIENSSSSSTVATESKQVSHTIPTSSSQAINVAKMESFGPIEHMPLTAIRKSVANAMVTSMYTAPHVTLMLDVDATNLINLRATLKQEAIKAENGAIKLTFMPFFIKAVAKALAEDSFKLLNSTFNLPGNEILVKKYYNIGMAADTDKGLLVPVVKSADKLAIFDIAKEVNQLADKARKGTLSAAEMQGGTFTITNFGSAGLKVGTPIINYPEVAILGIGILESKAVLVNDNIAFHNFFPLSISIDHRVIDGAPAGHFMQRVKYLLENPALLLLD